MTTESINDHGDLLIRAAQGHGSDIASQRADDLDLMALADVSSRGHCTALDAACGLGGQAVRLAVKGATVLATDLEDFSCAIGKRAEEAGVKVSFLRSDLRTLETTLPGRKFDIICCQRAIHYLPWHEALATVRSFAALLNHDGRLYLSASGITSELATSYQAASQPLEARYAPLCDAMAKKHGILGPVCLYGVGDLYRLFADAGLLAEQVFSSPFGNVKGIARPCGR